MICTYFSWSWDAIVMWCHVAPSFSRVELIYIFPRSRASVSPYKYLNDDCLDRMLHFVVAEVFEKRATRDGEWFPDPRNCSWPSSQLFYCLCRWALILDFPGVIIWQAVFLDKQDQLKVAGSEISFDERLYMEGITKETNILLFCIFKLMGNHAHYNLFHN